MWHAHRARRPCHPGLGTRVHSDSGKRNSGGIIDDAPFNMLPGIEARLPRLLLNFGMS